jgi:hypothetical protein
MFLEYWWSTEAEKWLVAEKATGALIAQFPMKSQIETYFMPEIISHREEECECPSCSESEHLEQDNSSLAVDANWDSHDYIAGGYGDSFSS